MSLEEIAAEIKELMDKGFSRGQAMMFIFVKISYEAQPGSDFTSVLHKKKGNGGNGVDYGLAE